MELVLFIVCVWKYNILTKFSPRENLRIQNEIFETHIRIVARHWLHYDKDCLCLVCVAVMGFLNQGFWFWILNNKLVVPFGKNGPRSSHLIPMRCRSIQPRLFRGCSGLGTWYFPNHLRYFYDFWHVVRLTYEE